MTSFSFFRFKEKGSDASVQQFNGEGKIGPTNLEFFTPFWPIS
jgi:hypothetical protein